MDDGLVLINHLKIKNYERFVLILVVVDDGLVRLDTDFLTMESLVLILVVVEDGLVPVFDKVNAELKKS